jgi:hypothetical protein
LMLIQVEVEQNSGKTTTTNRLRNFCMCISKGDENL